MKIKKILIILGTILVFVGLVLLLVPNNKVKNDNKEDIKEEKLLINTSDKEGKLIDNSSYEKISFADTKEIYFYDYEMENKYFLKIPKNMTESQLALYSKNYENDFLKVHTQISDDFNLDELIKISKIKYIGTDYNYSLGKDITKINDFNISYIYIQSMKDDNYEEKYQVFIELNSDKFAIIDFTCKNRRFDDKTLNKIFNTIKVEKNTDKFDNNKVDGEYLIGNLKQVHPLNNKTYNVSYKIDKDKYEVLESSISSFDRVTFKSNNDQGTLVLFEMFYDTVDLKNQLDGYIKSRVEDGKIVHFDTSLEEINGKKYSYYLVEIDDVENKYYYNYVYFIDKDFSYVISFKSDNVDENIINDFYDIKVDIN